MSLLSSPKKGHVAFGVPNHEDLIRKEKQNKTASAF